MIRNMLHSRSQTAFYHYRPFSIVLSAIVISVFLLSSCISGNEEISKIQADIDKFNEDNLQLEDYSLLDSIAIDSVFEVSKTIGYKDGISSAAVLMLRFFRGNSNRISLRIFLNKHIKLFQTLQQSENYSFLVYELGRKEFYDSELAKATKYLLVANNKLKQERKYKSQSDVLIMLSTIQSRLGNKEKEVEYIKESLEVARSIDYPLGVSRALYNLGRLLDSNKDKAKKEEYILESLAISKLEESKIGILHNLITLTEFYKATNRVELSDAILVEYKGFFDDLLNDSEVSRLKFILSTFYWKNGNVDLGRQLNKEIISDQNAKYLDYEKMESKNSLYQNYEASGELDSALYYYKLYIIDYNAINARDHELDSYTTETNYSDERIKLEVRNVNFRNTLIGSLIVLILGLVILFFYLINKAQRDKVLTVKEKNSRLNINIQLLNQELTSSVLNEMRLNEYNKVNKELLRSVRNKVPFKYQDNFNDIIDKISIRDAEVTWERFQKEFTVLNPNFFTKLYGLHPDLNVNEKKYARLYISI